MFEATPTCGVERLSAIIRKDRQIDMCKYSSFAVLCSYLVCSWQFAPLPLIHPFTALPASPPSPAHQGILCTRQKRARRPRRKSIYKNRTCSVKKDPAYRFSFRVFPVVSPNNHIKEKKKKRTTDKNKPSLTPNQTRPPLFGNKKKTLCARPYANDSRACVTRLDGAKHDRRKGEDKKRRGRKAKKKKTSVGFKEFVDRHRSSEKKRK